MEAAGRQHLRAAYRRALAAAVILSAATLAVTAQTGRGDARAADEGRAPMPLSPSPEASVGQNPPDFSWPALPGESRWELELRGPDGKTLRLPTSNNRMSLPFELAPGGYEWRILPAAGGRPAMRFTVGPDAPRFVVAAGPELLRVARSKPHPRFELQPPGPAGRSELQALMTQARAQLQKGRLEEAPAHARGGAGKRTVEQASAQRSVKRAGQKSSELLALAAVALAVDRADPALAHEARELLIEAAGWDPSGPTGIGGDDLAARDMVWSLALLYDAVHAQLAPAERQQALASILARIADLRKAFLDGGRMQRKPFDAHGWVAWAGAAAAVALVAGDDPRADELFLQLVPGFIASISPWGGTEGGFGNGTAYGHFDIGALALPFDMIGAACGVDLYAKPWLKHIGRFLTYTLPPGAPEGPFGDAHERVPTAQTALAIRALAARVVDPVLHWSASAQPLERKQVSALWLATAGRGEARPVPSATTAASASFADVGWVAMHDDLANPRRVSVYFKSSPFGSFNHSHADQNAIVLHASGRALLKGSGYYDYYGSDHFTHWYQTTQAQNAITFDGGQGQPTQSMAASGRIVYERFTSAADIVTGDATRAYAGQLTRARRTVVFVRPNLVLVHDQLASDTPRRWEWNLHADTGLSGSDRSARVEIDRATVCIDLLEAPAVRYGQTDRFPYPPRDSGRGLVYPDQQHGRFTALEASREAEFVVALRVGCEGQAPATRRQAQALEVSTAGTGPGRSVLLYGDRAELR